MRVQGEQGGEYEFGDVVLGVFGRKKPLKGFRGERGTEATRA